MNVGKAFIWSQNNLWRGSVIENIVYHQKYLDEGFEYIGILKNGKFPAIDFLKNGFGISVKTTNATGGFANILKNIDNLVAIRGAGAVEGRAIKNVGVHIYVPKGYDQNLLREVTMKGVMERVPIKILEF